MEKEKRELIKLITAYLKLQNRQQYQHNKENLTVVPLERAKELLKQYHKTMHKKLVDEP